MNTRNDWYVACTEEDLARGEPVAACVLDERMVLWRSGERIVALEDRCVHRAAALSMGRCEGENLRCMYHGMLFNGDGAAVEIPGQDIIPPNARVRAYPVTLRYGWAWVWMGDPAQADPGRMPALFDGMDLADFEMGGGLLDFAASAELISDNLLDFSHLPYVHANSFQPTEDWAKSTMTMKQLERGMRFERWLEDQPGRSFLEPLNDGLPCDEWLGYDYVIPGVLIMWVGAFPPGTARSVDHGRPDFSKAIARVSANVQAITPVSSGKSRYHFITGLHREAGGGRDLALVNQNVEVTACAFEEDRRIIEMQQQIIDRDPHRPIMPTVHDRGVTLYNRLKTRLIAEEGGTAEVVSELASAE